MPKVQSNLVEKCLRDLLTERNYKMNETRDKGETGVDIEARKGDNIYHIEVISYKQKGPARSKDFFQVFFRAISRLNDGATHCVIALPSEFEKGLPMRVKQYKIAWERIGNVFPELEIWLIDPESKKCKRTKWIEWLDTPVQI